MNYPRNAIGACGTISSILAFGGGTTIVAGGLATAETYNGVV